MSKGFFFNFFDDELPDRVRYSWSTTPVPIDMNCTHGVQWMWLVFQQCAVSPAEITAVVMGLISVFSWMLNGIPQIIENYKTGIPDQAVSLFLLIFWTIGDSFSLAGCLLTHQLVLQVVMAFYSIVNDTILLGQYFFYRMRHKRLLRGGFLFFRMTSRPCCRVIPPATRSLLPLTTHNPFAQARQLLFCR
uniref:Putative vacuolar amino acid transporter YPQ1 n=1 Tax=Schistocephalus solidus TaxID=70667 RepID=A0A0X3PBD1_SCHSO